MLNCPISSTLYGDIKKVEYVILLVFLSKLYVEMSIIEEF